MIHYHGTPLGGHRDEAARFAMGRHCLVSFRYQDDIAIVAEACQSFVIDSGAYTIWRNGGDLDIDHYQRWVVDSWARHPGFDWALIPDVIDGSEDENDRLVAYWPDHAALGVPVWHLHESLERLQRLIGSHRIVALGSSGEFATPNTDKWWERMADAMDAICDEHGRPPCKLHGLRMLHPDIVVRLPLASADSTNAAQNSGSLGRFGMYLPPSRSQRAAVIAERIEAINSPAVWNRREALGADQLLLWG